MEAPPTNRSNHSPTWNHPLLGADPVTLARALVSNGPIPPKSWPLVGALAGASLLRCPLTLCELALASARIYRAPPPRAPVFILGHWRSGTTHLFNLMSRDSRFAWVDPYAAGMPWDFLVLGRLVRPLLKRALPANRFIDAVAVSPDSPQEDEIGLASMQDLSYYHGIYFPDRFAFHFRRGVFHQDVRKGQAARWRRRFEHYSRKLLIGRPEATLLVKNPVYTARVAEILDSFPDARFVHIHRNPYVVYESTRKFYRALLPRFALQAFREDVADEIVLESYPRMIERLYKDVRGLGPGRFVELSFEELENDPLGGLETVYETVGIPGFTDARDSFRQYLDSISHYRKNTHVFTEDVIEQTDRYWGDLVRRWGYTPPAPGETP